MTDEIKKFLLEQLSVIPDNADGDKLIVRYEDTTPYICGFCGRKKVGKKSGRITIEWEER